MAAQQLNVRVGLLFDEKSLANIERSMRSSGQRLSRIGTDLSLSLSLPLAAFGVTAIKAAGDIESLTLALKSQLGTADAAAKELDKLTESAKKPGIGLEQAVRGSVRLQGIGLSADEARNTIEQMGNAIASTGGSAQELDGVTRQFAQIISKGRILQEDVTILSENMPQISNFMQQAFGTRSVEAIRNMGVTGKEFVLQITKMAEGLPRVESGIKNGIGNAIDSLKQSAAKVGFAINEAFDVTGAIESVSAAVLALAQGFSSLDPSVQKTILGFTGMLIAIGPLIKAKGALELASSQLIGTYNYLTGAGSLLGGITRTLTTAFIGLSTAAKAFVVIGLVTAVLALADSWGWFNEEATTAQKVQQSINDAMKDAEASITAESGAAKQLISVLQDETTSREAKAAALKDLQKINPVYFGQLRIENGAVVGLTEAYGAYIANLVLAAKAKKAEGKLIEIDEKKIAAKKELIADQEKLNKLSIPANKPKEGFQRDVGQLSGNASEAGAVAARITASKNLISQLELEEAEYDKIAKAGFEATVRAKGTITEVKTLGEASTETKNRLKTLAEVLLDVANAAPKAALIGDDESEAKIEALRKGIVKLIDAGFKPASAEVLNLKSQLDKLNEKPTDVVINIIKKEAEAIEAAQEARRMAGNPMDLSSQSPGGEQGLTLAPQAMATDLAPGITSGILIVPTVDLEAAKVAADQLADLAKAWQDTYIGAAQNIADATFSILGASSAQRFEDEKNAATEAADAQLLAAEGNAGRQAEIRAALSAKIAQIEKKEGKRKKDLAIAEATINTAVAITKAIGSAPPPFNIPAIVAASIAGAAQIATIAATPFARGTKYAPGGTALVGEQGPELINLPRGSQVFPTPQTNRMLSGMGGGSINLGGEFILRGDDMALLVQRAERKNERLR